MDFSKIKNKLLILLCVFVVIFPFFCVAGFCSEVSNGTIVNNLTTDNGVFVDTTSDNYCIVYNLIPGHNYRLYLKGAVSSRTILKSQEFPSDGVSYEVFGTLNYGDTIEFLADTNYIYISSISGSLEVINNIALTDLTNNYIMSVDSLVDNVGIGNLWNIFDISINYIVVVVLFAFGVYIIFRIIRKISKGKEGL